jgi:hypothetical protein
MRRRDDMLFTGVCTDVVTWLRVGSVHGRLLAARLKAWSVACADWILRAGDEVTTQDVRGVVFRPRYDWLTLLRACMPLHRDARGRPTVIATSRMHHLARHRRERLWGVRSAIEHDVRAVMRRTRVRCSLVLLLVAAGLYGILAGIDGVGALSAGKLPLAIAAFACVAAAAATPLLQPSVRVRRQIVLSHARCACCLERLDRSDAEDVSRCCMCGCAWLSVEVGEGDGEHHRCDGCAYDLSGVHEPYCPECGSATGRIQRAA